VVARDDEGYDSDELVEKKMMETTAGSGASWKAGTAENADWS
jgi:hypothetical protein